MYIEKTKNFYLNQIHFFVTILSLLGRDIKIHKIHSCICVCTCNSTKFLFGECDEIWETLNDTLAKKNILTYKKKIYIFILTLFQHFLRIFLFDKLYNAYMYNIIKLRTVFYFWEYKKSFDFINVKNFTPQIPRSTQYTYLEF